MRRELEFKNQILGTSIYIFRDIEAAALSSRVGRRTTSAIRWKTLIIRKKKMLAFLHRILDWFKNVFWKEEMELALVGLQNSGKTTFVNVIAVSLVSLSLLRNVMQDLYRAYGFFYSPDSAAQWVLDRSRNDFPVCFGIVFCWGGGEK